MRAVEDRLIALEQAQPQTMQPARRPRDSPPPPFATRDEQGRRRAVFYGYGFCRKSSASGQTLANAALI
jgi:hypothetical protein